MTEKQIEILEKAIKQWLEVVMGVTLDSSKTVVGAIRDGQILCKYIRKIGGIDLLPQFHNSKFQFYIRENIMFFLDACKKLGIKPILLFTPDDLLTQQNLFRVYCVILMLVDQYENDLKLDQETKSIVTKYQQGSQLNLQLTRSGSRLLIENFEKIALSSPHSNRLIEQATKKTARISELIRNHKSSRTPPNRTRNLSDKKPLSTPDSLVKRALKLDVPVVTETPSPLSEKELVFDSLSPKSKDWNISVTMDTYKTEQTIKNLTETELEFDTTLSSHITTKPLIELKDQLEIEKKKHSPLAQKEKQEFFELVLNEQKEREKNENKPLMRQDEKKKENQKQQLFHIIGKNAMTKEIFGTPGPARKENLLQINELNIKEIACGHRHAVILTKEGHVYAIGHAQQCGFDEDKFIDKLTRIVCGTEDTIIDQIFIGDTHNFVCSSGKCLGFGWNQYGQIGIGLSTNVICKPKMIGKLTNIKKCAPGAYHTLFLTTDGKVYSCGLNSHGQLGLGDMDLLTILLPRRIKKPKLKAIDISCGQYHSCILSENGELYTFGTTLGNESHYATQATPTLYKLDLKIERLSCGPFYICAIVGRQLFFMGSKNKTLTMEQDVEKVFCFQNFLIIHLSNGEIVAHNWTSNTLSMAPLFREKFVKGTAKVPKILKNRNVRLSAFSEHFGIIGTMKR